MDRQATTQEVKIQLLHGWFGSLVVHGLLLGSLLPLFRLSPPIVSKELFHWDVTLVQSTQPSGEPVQDSTATEPAAPKSTERTPMPTRTGRTIRQAASSAEPVAPIAHAHIASSAVSPGEAATPSVSEQSALNQAQIGDPLSQQPAMPTNPTTTEASAPQTVAAATNETSVSPSEVVQPSPSSAAVSSMEVAAPARLDYGWLQQAISQRLEELKRSSRPFLDQAQPLKVMVKAVVSREGTLLDSMVVKSSGLDRIDQEAIALVQRAFPMQLDRTLDRQRIVMRIPITYSRD